MSAHVAPQAPDSPTVPASCHLTYKPLPSFMIYLVSLVASPSHPVFTLMSLISPASVPTPPSILHPSPELPISRKCPKVSHDGHNVSLLAQRWYVCAHVHRVPFCILLCPRVAFLLFPECARFPAQRVAQQQGFSNSAPPSNCAAVNILPAQALRCGTPSKYDLARPHAR